MIGYIFSDDALIIGAFESVLQENNTLILKNVRITKFDIVTKSSEMIRCVLPNFKLITCRLFSDIVWAKDNEFFLPEATAIIEQKYAN